MKFATCNYGSFKNSQLEYKLRLDDVFVVSPEFEENPAFIEGLRVGAFQFVEIKTVSDLKKVIGVTDEMIAEFEAMVEIEEVVTPEPEPPLPPQDEDEITVDEKPPETTDEVKTDGDTTVDVTPDVPDEDDGDEKTPLPDLGKMSYKELQTYALELEKQFNVQINRRASTPKLKAEIQKVIKEKMK